MNHREHSMKYYSALKIVGSLML